MSSFSNPFLQSTPTKRHSLLVASPTGSLPVSTRVPLQITARYRGLNTDLRKVRKFKMHEYDSGSAQVQVARFTARVTQLTAHLQVHKHDYASTRGLQLILGKRRRLLQYLYDNDRESFNRLISELKIRFPMPKTRKR